MVEQLSPQGWPQLGDPILKPVTSACRIHRVQKEILRLPQLVFCKPKMSQGLQWLNYCHHKTLQSRPENAPITHMNDLPVSVLGHVGGVSSIVLCDCWHTLASRRQDPVHCRNEAKVASNE